MTRDWYIFFFPSQINQYNPIQILHGISHEENRKIKIPETYICKSYQPNFSDTLHALSDIKFKSMVHIPPTQWKKNQNKLSKRFLWYIHRQYDIIFILRQIWAADLKWFRINRGLFRTINKLQYFVIHWAFSHLQCVCVQAATNNLCTYTAIDHDKQPKATGIPIYVIHKLCKVNPYTDFCSSVYCTWQNRKVTVYYWTRIPIVWLGNAVSRDDNY